MVVAAIALAACTEWQPMATPLQPLPGRSLPYGVRVTRTDGSRSILVGPVLRSDSLIGTWNGAAVGVPVGEIEGVERERFSVLRTLAVFVGLPLVAALTLVLAVPRHGDL
jgi:hypothetical protein